MPDFDVEGAATGLFSLPKPPLGTYSNYLNLYTKAIDLYFEAKRVS